MSIWPIPNYSTFSSNFVDVLINAVCMNMITEGDVTTTYYDYIKIQIY